MTDIRFSDLRPLDKVLIRAAWSRQWVIATLLAHHCKTTRDGWVVSCGVLDLDLPGEYDVTRWVSKRHFGDIYNRPSDA